MGCNRRPGTNVDGCRHRKLTRYEMNTIRNTQWFASSVDERSHDRARDAGASTAPTPVGNVPIGSVTKSACGVAAIQIQRTSSTSLRFSARHSGRRTGGDARSYSERVIECPRKRVNSNPLEFMASGDGRFLIGSLDRMLTMDVNRIDE